MSAATQTATSTCGDMNLLAYAQHMAETAHCDEARNMFKKYVDLERKRLQEEMSSRPRVEFNAVHSIVRV